jgi:hypothetical protein
MRLFVGEETIGWSSTGFCYENGFKFRPSLRGCTTFTHAVQYALEQNRDLSKGRMNPYPFKPILNRIVVRPDPEITQVGSIIVPKSPKCRNRWREVPDRRVRSNHWNGTGLRPRPTPQERPHSPRATETW